jgi:hypothetical protein
MKAALNVAGTVLVLIVTIWFLQGVNLLPDFVRGVPCDRHPYRDTQAFMDFEIASQFWLTEM